MILLALIDGIDETGYLRTELAEIAERLGTDVEDAEAVLGVLQGFDPVGVGARDLAECLSLQLKAQDRLDPAMAAMLSRLDLLAKRDMGQLSTPLDWSELSPRIKSDHFRLENIRDRLAKLKRDPWEGFFKLRQTLNAKTLARLEGSR